MGFGVRVNLIWEFGPAIITGVLGLHEIKITAAGANRPTCGTKVGRKTARQGANPSGVADLR